MEWDALLARVLAVGAAVPEVAWIAPGEDAAVEALCGAGPEAFLTSRLKLYEKRNDPNETRALSGLSPWLHFGHLSAQRVVLESKKFKKQHSAARLSPRGASASPLPSASASSSLLSPACAPHPPAAAAANEIYNDK